MYKYINSKCRAVYVICWMWSIFKPEVSAIATYSVGNTAS